MDKTKKIRIVENVCIITSTINFDTLQKLEKYESKSLSLFTTDNEGNIEEIFKIGTGKAQISKYGIVFERKNKDGKAQLSLIFPNNVKDKKAWLIESWGKQLNMLKAVEENVALEAENMEKAYASLEEDIYEE